MQFDLSRNIDGAAQDVQQAINAASGLLPSDLPSPPTYRKTNPADRPVLIFAVHSDGIPVYRIDDYAYTILAQKLSTVPGVSEARIFGQKPYAVHVQINPGALASRGLGFEDVRNALAATTIDKPKGDLEGAHQTYTLDTNDQLFNAAAYNNVIIAYKQRRAGARQGCRPGDQLGAKRSHRRLVRRYPSRGVGDPAPSRRQHDPVG